MINLRNKIGIGNLYTLCLIGALLLSGCGSSKADIKEVISENEENINRPFDVVTPPENALPKPNITITVYHQELIFNWTYPSEAGCDSLILSRSGEIFSDSAAGEIVYIGSGLEYVDTGLTNGTTYNYMAAYKCSNETHSEVYEISGVPADVEVKFEDKNLEDAIRIAANKAEGEAFHVSDILQITSLALDFGPTVLNLEGIQHMRSLTVLHLSSNQIKDISLLSNLKELRYLLLIDNPIKDITPLSKLTQLDTLILINTQIEDIHPLSSLKELKFLTLINNLIKDIRPLSSLINLQTLLLSHNEIENIPPLSDLIALTFLDLSNNPIENVQSLVDLSDQSNSQLRVIELLNINLE